MQEATITFVDNGTPGRTSTDKEFIKFKAEDGRVFTCWSSTEALKIAANVPAKVKFTVKEQGQYTNYTIHAVADGDGNWPDTGSGGKASGGGRAAKADPEKLKQDKDLEIARNQSIQRQQGVIQAVLLINAGQRKYDQLEDTFNDIMVLITTPWEAKAKKGTK